MAASNDEDSERIRFAVHSRIWSFDFKSNWKEILSKTRRFGYEGIEIPVSASSMNHDKLKAALSKEPKITPIVSVGGTIKEDLSSSDPIVANGGVHLIERAICFCSEIGGSMISGPMYAAVGKLEYTTQKERHATFERLAEAFSQVACYAGERNILIALEPLCRYDTSVLNTVEEGIKLVDLISEDNVGLLLDTFHMNIEEKSLYHSIVSAGDRIFHFHASESDRGTPGTGQIRWDKVVKALNDIKYRKWICVESFTPNDPRFSPNMKVWRKLAPTQDDLARDGLIFLKKGFLA